MKTAMKTVTALSLVLLCALSLVSPVLAQQDGDADAKAAKHFTFMDKNKDGVLTEDEFKMMGQDYKMKFMQGDADKDGKMTQDEFKAWDAKQGESGMKM
mgnify:CR=1 FL=1